MAISLDERLAPVQGKGRSASLIVIENESRNLPRRHGPEERILTVMRLPVSLAPPDTSLVDRLVLCGKLPVPLADLYQVGHGL